MSEAQAAEYRRQVEHLLRLLVEGRISFRRFIILACTVYTEFNPSYAEENAA